MKSAYVLVLAVVVACSSATAFEGAPLLFLNEVPAIPDSIFPVLQGEPQVMMESKMTKGKQQMPKFDGMYDGPSGKLLKSGDDVSMKETMAARSAQKIEKIKETIKSNEEFIRKSNIQMFHFLKEAEAQEVVRTKLVARYPDVDFQLGRIGYYATCSSCVRIAEPQYNHSISMKMDVRAEEEETVSFASLSEAYVQNQRLLAAKKAQEAESSSLEAEVTASRKEVNDSGVECVESQTLASCGGHFWKKNVNVDKGCYSVCVSKYCFHDFTFNYCFSFTTLIGITNPNCHADIVTRQLCWEDFPDQLGR